MRIYGVVYGDKVTDFIPYRNDLKEKAWRFENQAMINIIKNEAKDMNDNELLGILSWKFTKKTGITKIGLEDNVRLVSESMDVIDLTRWSSHRHFMNWSNDGHFGITEMIKKVCIHIGFVYNNDCENIIFANQFICRKWIYCEYVNMVIIPAIELLEGEMWNEVNKPSGYTAGIELKKLKELTGLDFYNYIPFILERLFMQFLDNRKYKLIKYDNIHDNV